LRENLVAALVDCANNRPCRWRTRKFLNGLSSDELQFLAEYLGSRILGSEGAYLGPAVSSDREHKMILLKEFLGRSGFGQVSPRTRGFHFNWRFL